MFSRQLTSSDRRLSPPVYITAAKFELLPGEQRSLQLAVTGPFQRAHGNPLVIFRRCAHEEIFSSAKAEV